MRLDKSGRYEFWGLLWVPPIADALTLTASRAAIFIYVLFAQYLLLFITCPTHESVRSSIPSVCLSVTRRSLCPFWCTIVPVLIQRPSDRSSTLVRVVPSPFSRHPFLSVVPFLLSNIHAEI